MLFNLIIIMKKISLKLEKEVLSDKEFITQLKLSEQNIKKGKLKSFNY